MQRKPSGLQLTIRQEPLTVQLLIRLPMTPLCQHRLRQHMPPFTQRTIIVIKRHRIPHLGAHLLGDSKHTSYSTSRGTSSTTSYETIVLTSHNTSPSTSLVTSRDTTRSTNYNTSHVTSYTTTYSTEHTTNRMTGLV